MKKIAIITDSSADINEVEAKALGIHVIRMPILIDGVEYIEEVDIKLDEFVSKMREGATCKTSQPPVGKVYEIYENLLRDYDEIIHIPLSRELSGTYDSAMQVAKDFEGRVIVIDAGHVAYVLANLCMQIKEMINKGMTSIEIKQHVEENSHMWACLLPGELEYLRRGGRISSAAAKLGNLLKIVPILKVEDGKIDVFEKVRTRKKAIRVATEAVLGVAGNKSDYYWFVLHADAIEEAEELAKELTETISQDVVVRSLGSVIMAHTGPGTIGIGYTKKIA